MALIIPVIFVIIIIVAVAKKVNVFSSFCAGAEEGMKFALSLLPLLACVFMMCNLFEISGISAALTKALSPVTGALGIPEELTKLMLIKPFSGSGSLTLLTEILEKYGSDSYISRCACTIYASSETVFYVFAVYFAKSRCRPPALPLAIVLVSAFLSTVISCLLCRFM